MRRNVTRSPIAIKPAVLLFCFICTASLGWVVLVMNVVFPDLFLHYDTLVLRFIHINV